MKKSFILLAFAALTSGCLTTRAQTPVERPALDVPPAPPRVIDPAPPPEPPAPEPVPELPTEKIIPAPKPRPTSIRDKPAETVKPDPPKPDLPPVELPPPPSPTPTLRNSVTADAAAVDRIREVLRRAQALLNGIDYQRLSRDLQNVYDQAKSHIEGAEMHLRTQGYDLAKELADKAEKLAKGLTR